MPEPPAPDLPQLVTFLTERFGTSVRGVSPLGAGMWSRAFSFDTDDAQLVVRFGYHDDDFAKDRMAASWQQPDLPVPAFFDMGEAFGTFYAVTARAEGRFLDQLAGNEVHDVLPSVLHVLDALRQVPVADGAGFGVWDRSGVGAHSSWRDAILVVESARPHIAGWKRRLHEWPEHEQVFADGLERLHTLAERVPSGHDVIHRDWLNRNVLVTGTVVTSVFDWGSSMYGDHLYDVAWLTFCASYTVGLDRIQVRRLARRHHVDAGIDPDDFDLRVSCYELHIGLGALAHRAFLGDEAGVQWLATKILASSIQEGGPVPV